MPNPGVPSEGPRSDPHVENLYRYLEANEFRDNTQFSGKKRNSTSQTPIQSHNSYANVHTSPLTAMRLPVFWDLMKDLPWLVLLQDHSQNKQFLWGYNIIFKIQVVFLRNLNFVARKIPLRQNSTRVLKSGRIVF